MKKTLMKKNPISKLKKEKSLNHKKKWLKKFKRSRIKNLLTWYELKKNIVIMSILILSIICQALVEKTFLFSREILKKDFV